MTQLYQPRLNRYWVRASATGEQGTREHHSGHHTEMEAAKAAHLRLQEGYPSVEVVQVLMTTDKDL